MAIKKSELYSSLWQSCDELRGGMDASQYKDYVLVLLFMKYVSDKYAGKKDALIEVPAGGSFADMAALKGKKEIGDRFNKIIGRLADANSDLIGVITVADFDDDAKLGSGNEKVERLSNLIAIFEGLDFGKNTAEGDDLLGDAYEYLMRHFATQSGKSKGQFYTPAEVSRVMAKVIGVGSAKSGTQTIHDPTCGSGSLLLRAHDEAKGTTGFDLALYGQENDNATTALAKMNMILHDCPTADILQGNVLANPRFTAPKGGLKTFDFVVANPPFSFKSWRNGFNPEHDEFKRFALGIPPAKNGDYAFLLHIIATLKSTGKAAVNLPHGVLFRNAEADIRRNVVKRGYIKGIIGLPPNLFYGTGIPACIVVLDKEDASARKGIFMIDASKGFIKDGNKNRLRAQDIHKIVDVFTKRLELARYSRMVPLSEIEANDYNLNLPRYIDSTDPEDLHDIDAHLRGGIPDRDVDALQPYWKVLPSVRDALFGPGTRAGYNQLNVPANDVKATIFESGEFSAFRESITKTWRAWIKANEPHLNALGGGAKPKALIELLSEALLEQFRKCALIDAYDVYQHLMDYWAETMQDDVYLVALDGWKKAAQPRVIVEKKGEKNKEQPDFVIGKTKYKADLVPALLIVANYFAAERDAIDALDAGIEATEQSMQAIIDEHGGDEGLIADLIDEKGKLANKDVAARLKEIGSDKDAAEERNVLRVYAALAEEQSDATKKKNAAVKELHAKVAAKYSHLSEDEIKHPVIKDKWLASLTSALEGEMNGASRRLARRVTELAERYAVAMPQLSCETAALSARVDEHLRSMGAVWE